MRSRLHRYTTPRHPFKGLLHRFRRCWQFLFQDDFACFIQNAIRTRTISEIQPNRELPLENVFSTRRHSANLLHRRSPFLCALSTSNHWERIASRRRPAFSSHLVNGVTDSETASLTIVHSETLGLWLCSIVRDCIGLIRRLACLEHELTSAIDTPSRN